MGMKYRSLARSFHTDRSNDAFNNHAKLARQRLEADSTFRTGVVTPSGRTVRRHTTRDIHAHGKDTSRGTAGIPALEPNPWRHALGLHTALHQRGIVRHQRDGRRTQHPQGNPGSRGSGRQGEEGRRRPQGSVQRIRQAVPEPHRQGLRTAGGNRDIRDIYDKVVLDEINESDKPDGELFRKGDVEIQGPHGLAIHNGVKGEGNIGALLTDMIHLATSDEIPRLQSAIMSHFLFEYVHPFYDGNGRTGRYLLALYLNHDLTMPTVLSLSRTMRRTRTPTTRHSWRRRTS